MTSTLGIKKIQYPNGTNSITIDSSGSADITTANITTAAITTANITNATATGTITTPSINGGQIGGRRNIIINGGMQISQRATSSTGLGATNGYYTLDRMRHVFGGSTAGRLTSSQSTDAPSGFGNSLKFECTTADTSIAAGEYLMLQHKIEAQNLQSIKKGTSDAEEVTVSFYVKGNASATYALELYDNDNNRQCSKLFSVTTSWTRVILTYPADTTGAFGNDNDVGLSLTFWLHAGSTFTSGTLNSSAFAASSNSSRATGISSFFDSTDRTFFITGLQLEVGSQATSFEHRSFGEELALCQRYFYKHNINSSSGPRACQYHNSYKMIHDFFPVTMRAFPTATATFNASFTSNSLSTNVGKFYVLSSYDAGHNYYMESGQYDAEL